MNRAKGGMIQHDIPGKVYNSILMEMWFCH